MAQFVENGASLKLKLNKGLDIDGKEMVATKSFSNLKESASADDVLAVAEAIGGLQQYDHYETRVSKEYIVEA